MHGHDVLAPCRPGTMSGWGEWTRSSGAPDEAVERRPAEPVPGEVQRAHGQAPVDEADVRRPGAAGIALLERGREEVEAVLRGERRAAARARAEDVGADPGGRGRAGRRSRATSMGANDSKARAADDSRQSADVVLSPGSRPTARCVEHRPRGRESGGEHLNIGVVGTGYVGPRGRGLPRGERQLGRLRRQRRGEGRRLRRGEIPIYEPGLNEMVPRNVAEERLRFTTDLDAAVQASEVIFIAVGTPQDEDGSADLTPRARRGAGHRAAR